ncbi:MULTISPECIES: hypothetical protein [unclassified Bradyrhizobium]|uniref:hypothetical protein n=1 Tax=unclassified Bradyrhizobium TaxID=2631580 RepID=UPI0028E1A9F3|nr:MULTISPECIES: hypothetical protein [unclassified Bradyrhizobium]
MSNAETLLLLADHQAALAKARTIGQAPLPLQGLNAPIANEIDKWFRRIWDNIEQLVIETFKGARERAEVLRDEVMVIWSQAQQELAGRVEELRTRVMNAIDSYLRGIVESALARITATVVVGGATLVMTSVSVQHSVKVSTSLKTALDGLLTFVAEGSLAVTASYGKG